MNNDNTGKLRGVVELLLENSSRINEAKPQKYWHPLSQATYGIEEIMEAIDSMCSFRTTMWEKTQAFEKAFAEYQGCKHAVMVNSGSSADLLMCFGLTNPAHPRLQPGDEILIPVVTWPTQIWSAMMAGLKVKLVDVNPSTLNADFTSYASAATPGKTKAIFLVHLMGLPCDLSSICSWAERNGIIVLEDCCEALGSTYGWKKVGNFGLASSFSFFFAHNCVTMEGGMICTNDDDFARQARIMRAHGWLRNVEHKPGELDGFDIDPRYAFVNWGFNLRPTELQAGFGIHQIKKVHAWNQLRHAAGTRFYQKLAEVRTDFLLPHYDKFTTWPVWFALPIVVGRHAAFTRRQMTDYLEAEGVETRPIVTGNVARHPVGKLFPEFKGEFFGADYLHENGFYVGLSPFTTDENLDRVIGLIASFAEKHEQRALQPQV